MPIVLEAEDYVGGISRTANYKGNRIDIGGHRFFSKSDRVMEWWLDRMPMQQVPAGQATIAYQRKNRDVASGRAGARPGAARPGDARAAAEEPHLFPPQVLRLSHHAQPRHDPQAGPAADDQDRFQLPPRGGCFPSGRKRTWRSSSSTASAASCIAPSSSPIRRKCGASAARRSAPSGGRSGSRDCRSWAP